MSIFRTFLETSECFLFPFFGMCLEDWSILILIIRAAWLLGEPLNFHLMLVTKCSWVLGIRKWSGWYFSLVPGWIHVSCFPLLSKKVEAALRFNVCNMMRTSSPLACILGLLCGPTRVIIMASSFVSLIMVFLFLIAAFVSAPMIN